MQELDGEARRDQSVLVSQEEGWADEASSRGTWLIFPANSQPTLVASLVLNHFRVLAPEMSLVFITYVSGSAFSLE